MLMPYKVQQKFEVVSEHFAQETLGTLIRG